MRRKWRHDPGDFDSETAERIRRGIRRIKRSKGMTLKELSVKTGYSDPFLSRLLGGDRRLSMGHVNKLSRALRVPISAFEMSAYADELIYDKRLTPQENRNLERMLYQTKKELVASMIKSRRRRH